ncbi:Uncharacterised protein [Shigella flexneri]|uniref:PPM-type phosphatase domain-containing protein n=1 Tax=Shigella flexneri TaxID=623 RepID=A0A658Z4L6_SHIFL|nr:Uncharacterised protein [Shigella flexneri]
MQVAWLNDQQPLLVMFLADGAGSVSQGGEGAMLAVNEAMAYMSQKVQGGELGLNDILATDIVLTVRQRLYCRGGSQRISSSRFCLYVSGIDFIG